MLEYNDKPFYVKMGAYDKTITIDFDHPDVTIDDAIEAVVGCLYGMTFNKEQIIKGMQRYVEDAEIY